MTTTHVSNDVIESFEQLMAKAKSLPTRRMAVVAPYRPEVLESVLQAEREDLAHYFLVGDETIITSVANSNGITLNPSRIIHEPDASSATPRAVAMVRNGEADLLMKGHLHTGAFLKAIMDRENGLRSNDKLLSQAGLYQKPFGKGLLIITDCAINISPDLNDKLKILDNAISMAHKLGWKEPRVAALAALETVNSNMVATMDAALLSKMSDRGQIQGAIVDGPLGLDNAISPEAAIGKNIKSPVAGRADILLVPGISAGNFLHKAIAIFAKVDIAGLALGTKAPIVMTSRSDSMRSKLLSIALGCVMAD
ncbi:bifunctional enoyl-CoA hydratase/phosphate acetyltransferase [Desulfopila aestuarii]|uniref:Phosphate butyryltransferase n=1 Tax=Desulfopila aestuarii DSM 18488 TaxID=1121416 RepID=A0A1M7XYL5_9BACT|nr:bifunctional enoyl-CoA hydratase/phosphate acetyltransferase [Desulfopila aestuarii]SHO44094.1 phosphate butyryltransferase [Desulfopila aestuarii DSM 18488]